LDFVFHSYRFVIVSILILILLMKLSRIKRNQKHILLLFDVSQFGEFLQSNALEKSCKLDNK
jgi:hypothetical protein